MHFALGLRQVDSELSRMALVLALVWAAATALALATILMLRPAVLRPARDLALAIARLGPDNLAARVPVGPVPQELRVVIDCLNGVFDRLNEQSRSVMTAWVGSHPARPIAPWVGVMKCAECHTGAFATWKKTAHAHAITTLRDIKRDFTKACVFCHVTGWDAPDGGGFADPASTPGLNDVQCEACHGPGAAHVADPSAPYGAVDTPARCVACHDQANSAEFNYVTYWPRIAH